MNIFLSLSDNKCLTKAYPVPIKRIVMKSSAPFNLMTVIYHLFKIIQDQPHDPKYDCVLTNAQHSTTLQSPPRAYP